MRSMNVLVCAAFALSLFACQKAQDTAGAAGAGSAAGSNAAGSGSTTDGGSSGSAAVVDGSVADTDGSANATTDAATPPVEAPPAIADLAAALATGICGGLLDCVGKSKLSDLVGGEACEARVTAELLSGEFAYLQASIDAHRVKLDSTQLDACSSGIKDLGCLIQTDNFPAACEQAVQGQLAVGKTCTISSDCAGTAFCQLDACPAHCAELLAAGDQCTKDEECGDNLICLGGKCAVPGHAGAACSGTSGKVCALGFTCWNGTQSVTGECHSNSDTLVASEGATCEPGGALCKEGLACVYFDTALTNGFHCEKPVASGAKCHQGLPGQCPGSEYCDAAGVTVAGTCKPKPTDGQACVGSGVCAPSFVCVPNGSGGGLCRRIENNGGACKIHAACRSGYCSAAICEPPPVCN